MARILSKIADHPVSYADAMREGLVRAVCTRVIDGDTADFLLDLGWMTYSYARVRIYGIDTPELRGTKGRELAKAHAATERLAQLVHDKPVLLRSYKDRRTFDRFVAEVFVPARRGLPVGAAPILRGSPTRWCAVAQVLCAEGLARPFAG